MDFLGKPGLVKYGIEEEQSDIRAHVSVMGKCVYVYPTKSGIAAIKTGLYEKRIARTGAQITADGFIVPPGAIKFMHIVQIPAGIMALADFNESDTTSQKGDKAVRVVQWLLRAGKFPLMAMPAVIQDTEMQVQGLDIIVRLKARIQVKCDWRAGVGIGCTGNLYLQIAECNPLKRH